LALSEDILQRWRNSEMVLLGGSAGSFRLIFQAVRSFTMGLNKAVVVIIHRKRNFISEMEDMFTSNMIIRFKEIKDKDKIENNTVYMAPPNYHTLIEKGGYFSLDVSDDVWYSKPSIDVTFESAGDVYCDRCTAILLSGANQDGAEGLLRLRGCGALTIVQDPEDAEMRQMPDAAVQLNAAEFVMSTEEIIELLKKVN